MDQQKLRKVCYAVYGLVLLVFVLSITGPDLLFPSRSRPLADAPAASAPQRATPDAPSGTASSSPDSAGAREAQSGPLPSPTSKILAGLTPPKDEGRYGDAEGKCHLPVTNCACAGTFDVPLRPNIDVVWPFPKFPEDWRKALGDRLLAAHQGQLTDEMCQGFFMWGDYVWCNRAVEPTSDAYHPKDLQPEGTPVIGISFGIRDRDVWSELMGNRYGMATHLYDCFWGNTGRTHEPQGPLGYQADPQRSAARNVTSSDKCGSRRLMGDGCYENTYEAHRICLSSKPETDIRWKATDLPSLLKGRPPLSVHVKIDAEGAEWGSLADLADSPEDCAKIRTLDLEAHYSMADLGSRTDCSQQAVTRKVEIMEKLAQVFVTTGSTFRALFYNLFKHWNKTNGIEPGGGCVTTSTGWSLDQYCVSFTNRKLVEI